MTPANISKEPAQKNVPKSHSGSEDLTSQQTIEADGEILSIEYAADNKLSSVTVQEFPKVKGEVLPPIGVIKGEREKLLSRASSKGSIKPKIRSSSHMTEQEEEEEDDDDDIAPWLRNFGKSRAQTRARSRSSEKSLPEHPTRGSSEPGKSAGSMEDDKSVEPRQEGSSSMRKINSQAEGHDKDTIEIVSTDEPERKSVSQKSEIRDEREKENNATPWFHKVGKPQAQRPEPSHSPESRQADRSTSNLEKEENATEMEINVDIETDDDGSKEKARPKSTGSGRLSVEKDDTLKSEGGKEAVEEMHETARDKDKVKVEVKEKVSNNNQKLITSKPKVLEHTSVNEEKRTAREKKKAEAESKSKKRKQINADKRKIYEAYKKRRAEEIKKKQDSEQEEVKTVGFVRRTSSAKVPKELQERLNIEMDKRRQIRSSFGHVKEMVSPPMSDLDDEDVELEPAFDDLNLVMNKEDHDADQEGQEDENVPELISRMTVQPSVQSRLQNSRMTQQSLKSVSLAMELDLADDIGDVPDDENDFETDNQKNSLEIQDINLQADVIDNNNQDERNKSQGQTLRGQLELEIVEDQGHNEISGRESVHQNVKSSGEDHVSDNLEVIGQDKNEIANIPDREDWGEGEPDIGKGQENDSNEIKSNLSQGHENKPDLDQGLKQELGQDDVNKPSLSQDEEGKSNLGQGQESKSNVGQGQENKSSLNQDHQRETMKETQDKIESNTDEQQDIRSLMLESNRGIMTDEEKAVYSRMTSVQGNNSFAK